MVSGEQIEMQNLVPNLQTFDIRLSFEGKNCIDLWKSQS